MVDEQLNLISFSELTRSLIDLQAREHDKSGKEALMVPLLEFCVQN